MEIYLYMISAGLSAGLALYLKPKFTELLLSNAIVCKNYSGNTIALGGGLILLIPCIIGIIPTWKIAGIENIILYIMILFSMVLIGYLDDSLGDKNIKGFRGHIKSIFNKNLSTGIIKMIIGVITGFVITLAYYSKPLDIFINTVLFSFCVNFINLLDLRPGRGIKGFISLSVIAALWSKLQDIWILIPIMGAIVSYLPDELDEKYMLGDTGSNLLGGLMGMYMIKATSPPIKYFLLFFLVLLHIVAEFWSLSRIIESIPLLRRLDSFGQLKKERTWK